MVFFTRQEYTCRLTTFIISPPSLPARPFLREHTYPFWSFHSMIPLGNVLPAMFAHARLADSPCFRFLFGLSSAQPFLECTGSHLSKVYNLLQGSKTDPGLRIRKQAMDKMRVERQVAGSPSVRERNAGTSERALHSDRNVEC